LLRVGHTVISEPHTSISGLIPTTPAGYT